MIERLTELVEEAVYAEFERLSERGGVLGAMETMYQRGKIQEESLYYEHKKHDGSLPIVGVNTFLPEQGAGDEIRNAELIRSTEEEKAAQVDVDCAPTTTRTSRPGARRCGACRPPRRQAGNVFAELMETVKSASLGRISRALYAVGGQYRRNM